ncbi:hypothetical protein ARC20_14295 [Stenotrophomonas panacihumi]|uniref:Lipoprotein n=1 Tax=Stenotrophomonas panacihumi TaxID=676599 RepID=A0A0R0A0T1_9GAMM|nr:hypothetical protein [Stenotrophomonas panacihumi]KRG38844.1 hypothetical protein ARC20_14295 [Stenotrophomonas panacihumi]PTN53060.1 hypothetical protein C9J98_17575 [Stenotrophomonas panacihumi]
MRAAGGLVLAVMLAGCASMPDAYQDTRSDVVDQRLLSPSVAAAGAARIESYAMQPQQAFRMPLLHDNVDPALPADTPRTNLPPTTVCVRVIIDAQGAVQRTEPLLDRAECAAGADASNSDLLQAVERAALTWQYEPAAICHYHDVAPKRPGDCADADRIEPVPVTLNYAFTFQMERGQMRVQRAGR